MKKIAIIAFLLAVCVAAGRAQESRQDISLSGTGLIEPFIGSSTDVYVHSTPAYGALASYRFMLTPSSALEANYGITYQNRIISPGFAITIQPVNRHRLRTDPHAGDFGSLRAHLQLPQVQSLSRSGTGGIHLHADHELGHEESGCEAADRDRRHVWSGIAYEISPSFDIRANTAAW